jgi:hypothetical protein
MFRRITKLLFCGVCKKGKAEKRGKWCVSYFPGEDKWEDFPHNKYEFWICYDCLKEKGISVSIPRRGISIGGSFKGDLSEGLHDLHEISITEYYKDE